MHLSSTNLAAVFMRHKHFDEHQSTILFRDITKMCKIAKAIMDMKNELVFRTEEFASSPNVSKSGLLHFESNFSDIIR